MKKRMKFSSPIER